MTLSREKLLEFAEDAKRCQFDRLVLNTAYQFMYVWRFEDGLSVTFNQEKALAKVYKHLVAVPMTPVEQIKFLHRMDRIDIEMWALDIIEAHKERD